MSKHKIGLLIGISLSVFLLGFLFFSYTEEEFISHKYVDDFQAHDRGGEIVAR